MGKIVENEFALRRIEKQIEQMDERAKQLEQRTIELEERVKKAEALNNQLKLIIKQKDEYIMQAQELANNYATGKLMKLNHLMFRVKGQYISGSKEDKAEFKSWLKGKANHTNRTLGEGVRYNPWMVVNSKLQEALNCDGGAAVAGSVPQAGNGASVAEAAPVVVNGTEVFELEDSIKDILKQDYKKYDVIFLSVIDYNFRHQRPQHFAARFAGNGHRVFYVNANFIRPDSVTEIADKLNVVDFSNKEHNAIYTMQGLDTLDWLKEKLDKLVYTQAIRDAVVVVDYPNWVHGAEYLRKQYGFPIVTDYMDDFTGFLGTAEDFLKDNCIKLLKTSDLVVTSSQFLLEVAQKYTVEERIRVIRNGTEVDHFYQAVNMERNYPGDRKVIGYYGAVAHWFAWEKVCYLAKNMPECDVVIIGDVTEHREQLEKYDNIKLLGEKKYTELPEHLAYFDVCLIPFDTSTDLIKATNPVKFYEYLSAGKKIVATEIPELMPYKDEYVYMSNDDAQFLDYVKMCLEGTDSLKGHEECIAFAKENDWQKRYEFFEEACRARVPMVSVIVLTYNNLEYNKKCIHSILTQTAYPNYELIIVDNQSTDGTREYLQELEKENHPQVHIILNEENSGFAGGNNLGIKVAKGDYILLLNNDTVVSRGWIANMVKHLEQNEAYGMCGSVTNSIGNEAMIRVHYHNEQEMQEFAYGQTFRHMSEETVDVDRLAMFCTLIRKSIIDKVGGLDEQYKIGMFEDDDYAQAVMHEGYKLVIAEDAFVHHVNNASFKKLEDAVYKKIFDENRAKFEKKWNTTWHMPKYREGVTATCNEGMQV